jgi:hypothetical protein
MEVTRLGAKARSTTEGAIHIAIRRREPFKVGAAEHAPLDQLEPQHLAFGLDTTPNVV